MNVESHHLPSKYLGPSVFAIELSDGGCGMGVAKVRGASIALRPKVS